VRLWDCNLNTCKSEVPVGGYVDSLLLEGGFLFVGIHVQGIQPAPALIKVKTPRPSGTSFVAYATSILQRL
jgi:hypothetical protein